MGMTVLQVEKELGRPSTVQSYDGKYVLKYDLHEAWVGNKPYYFLFTNDDELRTLIEWKANEQEYRENQKAWGSAFQGFANSLNQYNQQYNRTPATQAVPVQRHKTTNCINSYDALGNLITNCNSY